ncbi:MAG: hypothetical protein PUA69_06220 [Erysipelotrichaceae bacterium]|nr:hypothetical protein [Erysipelotrichaceae bacterium]
MDASPFSQYKADNDEIHEQIRDGSKYWKKNDIFVSLMALGNQVGILGHSMTEMKA